MLEDYVKFAITGIKRKGIRSYLTMIGIFIGIAAVVSLISLGQGMQRAISKQFELLGTNIILVMPGASENLGLAMMSVNKLKKHDLNLIKGVNGVEDAGGFFSKLAQVKFHDEVKYCWVTGVTPELQDLWLEGTGVRITEGQERFKPNDKYKVAVGYLIGKGDFFSKKVDIGNTLEIDGQKFKVVAKISQIGNRQDDTNLYIPEKAAEDLFDVKDEYMIIMVKVKEGYDVDKVAERIKRKMRQDRGLSEGEEDFSVTTTEDIIKSVRNILDAVTWVLIGIAAISLIVGGVGIMNTMYTSVLERTNEIGVMKAVGAKNKDILLLFTIESGILGVIGGTIGIILGISMSKIVEIMAENALKGKLLEAYISPELIVGALAFSFFVGFISGILPAIQASKLNPVDALRYE